MTARRCEIGECDHAHLARGMCRMHYERERRGQPLTETPLVRQPEAVRFWAKVDRRGEVECWPWLGALMGRDVADGGGYGYFWRRAGSCYAHRIAYELSAGPIPAGLFIDHLCRNRQCVNPAHLEPVTNGENQRRGYAARAAA